MRKTVLVHCEELEKFEYPEFCPFNVSRAGKARSTISSMGLLDGSNVKEVGPKPARRSVLEKFHSAGYLNSLQRAAEGEFDTEMLYMGIGTGDCPVFEDMYDYGAWACGASKAGVEIILADEAELVFNPSGGLHHAMPSRAAGFCYINDVGIACLLLAEAGKKVLYLDVDVHHGDGVQDFFYERNDVMTISMHQSGRTLFPGTGFEDETGKGEGQGYCVNVPMPIGTYDQAYMKAFREVVVPLIKAYGADVIVLELGADALSGDPLAQLQLTNNTYADVIYSLMSFDTPILMTGGGGYHIENTVRAWTLAWSVLCGADMQEHHPNVGLGGVMLESTDWHGGLRDRELPVDTQRSDEILKEIDRSIEIVRKNIFPVHGF